MKIQAGDPGPARQDANDPTKAGRVASSRIEFGEDYQGAGRFSVFAVHTRFDAVEWFVTDAARRDEFGCGEVVRQARTFGEAVAGLS